MNSASTKTASTTVIGHFDGIEEKLAVGWVFDPARPDIRLQVEVLCDGEVVAMGVADQFREDLVRAGIGDGKHLFRLPVSNELMDGRIYSLSAREASTSFPLHGGNVSFGPETHSRDIDIISRKEGLQLLEQILKRPEFQTRANKCLAFAKLYRIGSLAQETGRLIDARYVWHTLQSIMGKNELCHCKLGEISLLEGNPTLALEEYRAAATENFEIHWAHAGMAQAFLVSGQLFDAEDALEIAANLHENAALKRKLNKLKIKNLIQRAEDLLNAGSREAAIAILKTAMIQQPECNTVTEFLGKLLIGGMDDNATSLPCMSELQRFRQTLATLEAILDDIERGSTLG